MPAPNTADEFLLLIHKSGLVDKEQLGDHLAKLRTAGTIPPEPARLAGLLVEDGFLTRFQAEQLLLGKWRRFTIGKYKILEPLGAGSGGMVYLCEHQSWHRRVAIKVLPPAMAADPWGLERFYREARALAGLEHPNIVRALDIDQHDELHFLVMEYVDGSSLQHITEKHGPMDILRAAHYIRQAALGLQHVHEAALVHRGIKPGDILVDRDGVVKIIDMGWACFVNMEQDVGRAYFGNAEQGALPKQYDGLFGTADYLAPEQVLSNAVDIRADIYSLGAVFYSCLAGRTLFVEGTIAQTLVSHQTRQPTPIRSIRPEVPEELVAVIDKMLAKDPGQRYQTPQDVADALAPFTLTPIPPPPDQEMPHLSPAARGNKK